MQRSRAWLLLFVIFLGACTMRSALDAMISPADRAFAQAMVDHLRTGDEAWLRARFRPDLWEQSAKQIGQVPEFFPTTPEATELVAYEISSSNKNGATERNKAFTLVTHGGGRWTVIRFRTQSTGGPDQVVEWNVEPHRTVPPELAIIRGFDALIPWIQGGLIVIVLLAGGLIFWLVRRSRRKREKDPLMNQGRGTP
jgi:hypothetical protein